MVTHDDTLRQICPEAENSTMGGYSNDIQMHYVKLVMHSVTCDYTGTDIYI